MVAAKVERNGYERYILKIEPRELNGMDVRKEERGT